MNRDAKLEACPFCGSGAEYYFDYSADEIDYKSVGCRNKSCWMYLENMPITEWNNRSPSRMERLRTDIEKEWDHIDELLGGSLPSRGRGSD